MDSPIHLPAAVEPSEGVVFQQLGAEVVLLDANRQEYFGLDPVGASMWNALVTHRRLDQVAKIVSDAYAQDPARVHGDLANLVAELLKRNLVRPVAVES